MQYQPFNENIIYSVKSIMKAKPFTQRSGKAREEKT
jgi:hypothetical protein